MLVVAPVVFACERETDFWRGAAGSQALARWFSGLERAVVPCAQAWVAELARANGLDTLEIPGADPLEDGDAPPGWGAALAALRARGEGFGDGFGDGLALLDFRYPHLEPGLLGSARERLAGGGDEVLATVRPCRDHPCQFQSYEDVADAGILALFDPAATRLDGPDPVYACLPVPEEGSEPFILHGRLDVQWLRNLSPPARGACLAGLSSTGEPGRPRLSLWSLPGGGMLAAPHGFACAPGLRAAFLPVGEGGPSGQALEARPHDYGNGPTGWLLPAGSLPQGLTGFAYAITAPSKGNAHDLLRWLEPSDGRWHFDHRRQLMVDGRSGAPITGRQSFPELYELCGALRAARPGSVDRLARLGSLVRCGLIILDGPGARRVRCSLDLAD